MILRRGNVNSRIAIVVLLMSLLVGCPDSESGHEAGVNPAAPNFELPLLNGQTVRLADLRGQIVILDFWATWCAPCEVQMPVLDDLWRDQDERRAQGQDSATDGVMIIGLSVDTDPVSKVAAWVAERGFVYPIAIADQDLAMRFGVLGFPTLIILDQNGGIHTRHTGVLSRPEIEAVLEEIGLQANSQD